MRYLLLLSLLSVQCFALRFAVIGDYGSGNVGAQQVAKLVKMYKPKFILTLGDNNYPRGCKSTIDKHIGALYSAYIGNYQGRYGQGALKNRFFPTMGNHDWDAKTHCLSHGSLPYLDYFTLPGNGRYYSFQKGNIGFFALDSDKREPDGNTVHSRQFEWFKAAIGQSKATFNIAFFHHPPYSSSAHGNQTFMQWPFKDLGVNLVLSGHDHNYERSKKDGLYYIVNGLSGAAYNYPQKTHIPESEFFYNKKCGFIIIDTDGKKMVLQFINTDDTVIDKITVKA